MINWLPDVCNDLHGELITIYWLMIVPLTVFLVMLELFKTVDKQPDAGKVITRAVISIVLLMSFKETMNLIAFVGDGIADKIDGLAKMSEIVNTLGEGFNRDAPALYKIREAFIFLLNFFSYFLAYFGIFIANALIHFTWSILFVCAPLMILCYIPEACAGICKNLYKGLLTVISWKILWSILSVLLLKLITEQTSQNSDNAITTAIINLSIALSILFIPFFTKSLMGDGLSGVASGIAGVAGGTVTKVTKGILTKGTRKGWNRGRESASQRYQAFKSHLQAPSRKERNLDQVRTQANLGFTPNNNQTNEAKNEREQNRK
jgi:hypothetical protein